MVHQMHVYLYDDGIPPNELHGTTAQFAFKQFGLVYWEGGVGQEAQLLPWYRVRHIMFDRGAAEEMDLIPDWALR